MASSYLSPTKTWIAHNLSTNRSPETTQEPIFSLPKKEEKKHIKLKTHTSIKLPH
uniref:Uncharacterized protein n=1 Tax=Glycine max TaxID=3847 RepID=C6TLT2_SOYBN|nr:unknown [Glycine max]